MNFWCSKLCSCCSIPIETVHKQIELLNQTKLISEVEKETYSLIHQIDSDTHARESEKAEFFKQLDNEFEMGLLNELVNGKIENEKFKYENELKLIKNETDMKTQKLEEELKKQGIQLENRKKSQKFKKKIEKERELMKARTEKNLNKIFKEKEEMSEKIVFH